MYQGLNYEEKRDFSNIKNVQTVLKYGDMDTIESPWITVLIPTYKRVNLLKNALESVLSQAHCDFAWDVLVLDNEPDDGKINETEKFIRKVDSPRVLYYRNDVNIRPGDNFNRGMQIARGEWVCFLHDDDLLIQNALLRIGKLIKGYTFKNDKPLGAISAKYFQFVYDIKKDKVLANIPELNRYFSALPFSYELYRLTHHNIWFTANIGGDVPSNGTTFNRKAALECGGFIEDFGISGDLILFYRLESKYRVYSTLQPLGFYRWGANTMVKPESTRRVIADGFSFREYVYSRTFFTKLLGKVLRPIHNRLFTTEVINAKNMSVSKEDRIKVRDFLLPNVKLPNKFLYAVYVVFIRKTYFLYKRIEGKIVAKKAMKNEVNL